jgi:hypothetical protein
LPIYDHGSFNSRLRQKPLSASSLQASEPLHESLVGGVAPKHGDRKAMAVGHRACLDALPWSTF